MGNSATCDSFKWLFYRLFALAFLSSNFLCLNSSFFYLNHSNHPLVPSILPLHPILLVRSFALASLNFFRGLAFACSTFVLLLTNRDFYLFHDAMSNKKIPSNR